MGLSVESVTIYDAEFLTAPGAPQRFWCGPHDPDPLTIQIGAVRLGLTPPFPMSDTAGWLVLPQDRDGARVALDPLVTRLTGLTNARIDAEGMPLPEALMALDSFSQGGTLYAWGKDELLSFAATLFVMDATSPIPARRFRSAVPLVVRAGEAKEVVEGLRSHTICDHFGLPEQGPAHDARGDAKSVASVLQHLLRAGRLAPDDFITT